MIEDENPFGKAEKVSLFQAESILESVPIPDELPAEIHDHILSDEPLSNDICTICLNNKTCLKGYKCNLCPLIICDQCTSRINIMHLSNNKHEHPLLLSNENSCNCNKCNKKLLANEDFSFNCQKCNFNLCLNCYNPERKEEKKEEETIHEHPIEPVNELKDVNCKLCENKINSGFKCNYCDLALCQKCAHIIYNSKKRKEFHEHSLSLNVRKNWKCNICENNFNEKVSFNCSKCNLDYCIECYLNK